MNAWMRYPSKSRSALIVLIMVILTIWILVQTGAIKARFRVKRTGISEKVVSLPEPSLKGNMSVEEAIYRRRSIRDYRQEPLSIKELSQLLWAAQGITFQKYGFRSAPSAGATYPLELYISVKEGGVSGLQAGIYHYSPFDHTIELVKKGDFSEELTRAALDQPWVGKAAICIIIAANFERTTSVYGERGVRYVYLEAGHVGQNIYLQATALNLGTVAIGAFHDDWVQSIVGCSEHPIYLFPVGRRW